MPYLDNNYYLSLKKLKYQLSLLKNKNTNYVIYDND